MSKPVNELKFDASGAESVLGKITKALQAQNKAVSQITNSFATFNQEGKLVEAVIKGITKSGQNFKAILSEIDNELSVVTNEASKTEAALKRLAAAKKAASGKIEFKEASKELTKAFKLPANISNVDKRQLDNLIRGSLRFVRSGDIKASKYTHILDQALSGSTRKYQIPELEQTRLKILQVINEYKKLKDLAQRRDDQTLKGQYPSKAQFGFEEWNKARPDLLKSLPLAAGITNLQRQQFDKLVGKSLKNVLSGDMYAHDFMDIFNKVRAGNKDMLTGLKEDTRIAIMAMLKEYEKINAKAAGSGTADKLIAKRNKAADLISKRVQKIFDFKDINPRRLEDVYAQLHKIQNLVLSGKLDLSGFRRSLNAFKTGTGPLKGAEETVRASLSRINRYASETTVSFDKLGRAYKFLIAQMTYDIGSSVVDRFKSMASAAAEFQEDIALIRTLSQDSTQTLDDWVEGITKVSNKLGMSSHEVSKAAYDLLSNQITTGSDTFHMLEIAGKFALSTNSNIEDSVNLMSSAINAYRLSAADAEKIAANFFAAIDLGRVKASDLANNMGRLATTMTSLAGGGMNALTETNAILTVMTRQGIQPDTSQVLLTNVLQKLLHPTEELKKVYKELGVASGEMFVKTYGLVGALEKLRDVSGGSKAKLTDFFNEIRSSQGGRILIDRLDEIKEDKAAIEKSMSSGSTYPKAVNLVTENYGRRFQQQMTQITNWFRQEFSQKILKVVLDVSDAFGGLSKIIPVVTKSAMALASVLVLHRAITVVQALVASYGGLITALTAAKGAALGLTAAFLTNPVTWAAVAITALVGLGIYAASVSEEFKKWPEDIRKANEELKKNNLLKLEEQLANIRNEFREKTYANQGNYLRYLSAYAQQLSAVREKEKEVADEARNDMANALEVVMANAKHMGSELEGAMTQAKNAAEQAAEAMRSAQVDNVSRWGHRMLHRNDVDMANARTYAQLTGDEDPEVAANRMDKSDSVYLQQLEFARRRASIASRSGDLQSTLDSFKSINQIMDEMASKTQKVPIPGAPGHYYEKFKHNPDQSEKAITAEYHRQLAVLEQIRKKKLADADLARQQLEVNKNLVAAMQDLANKISKFNPFDNQGKLKNQYKDASAALKELIDLQNKFNELASKLNGTQSGKVEVQKMFQEQMQRVQSAMERQRSTTGKEIGTERLQTQVLESQDKISEATEAANRAMELNVATAKKAGEAYQNAWAQYRQGAEQALRYELSVRDNTIGGKLLRGTFGSWLRGAEVDTPLKGTRSLQAMDEAAQRGNLDKAKQHLAEFEQFYREMGLIHDQMRAPVGNKPGATSLQVINEIKYQIAELEKAKRLSAMVDKPINAQNQAIKPTDQLMQQLESRFGTLGSAAENFGVKAKTGIEEARASVQDLVGAVEQAIQVLNSMQAEARAAAESVQSAAPSRAASVSTSVPEYRLGGVVKYARDGFLSDFFSGRYGKGTDTVPIMAGRDEMVINAHASKRFHSQLIAMNRGVDPYPRQTASSITHVGGIHVTVHGGQTDKHSVENIVNGINRAARRGAIRIGGNN